MQFQFNFTITEKLLITDEVFVARQKVQIASGYVSFSHIIYMEYSSAF